MIKSNYELIFKNFNLPCDSKFNKMTHLNLKCLHMKVNYLSTFKITQISLFKIYP